MLFHLSPAGVPGVAFFFFVRVCRADANVGEASSMLTFESGPAIAPYHPRQIVRMPRAHWADWRSYSVPAPELIHPTPAGTLTVAPAR